MGLYVHQFIDISVSTFWFLLIMLLLGMFVYKFLCRHVFLSLGYIHLGVPLLFHVVTFQGTAGMFSKVTSPFYIPNSNV